MTLLPVLGPGVAEGFAAGMLVSVACLLIVLAMQRAGRQQPGQPRPSREPSGQVPRRARRAAARRRRGKHAAQVGGSTRLAGRRRSRLLTTRD